LCIFSFNLAFYCKATTKLQSSQKTAKLFKMRATHQKRKQEEHIPQSLIITSARRSRVTEHSERTGEEAKKNCSVR
ncbi:hypothetical protein OFC24_26750, partial [Escherichia coli]|nr:hypothetical protein [Escherichia coli]